jgi:predicted RNA-binding protein (TIGR00451 family)
MLLKCREHAAMSEPKRRHFLSGKEVTQLFDDFSKRLKIDLKQIFGVKTKVELAETTTYKLFFINRRPVLAVWKNFQLPTLLFREVLQLLPQIVVNFGAVPHICSGADIMAPGIVRIEKNYKQNDYVVITDERYDKPLALAVSLTDSLNAQSLKHGKIALNMHYVGDGLWIHLKKLTA